MKDKSILEQYNNGVSMYSANAVVSYWNKEHQEMKYQIGEGCSIDQLLGQWHADMREHVNPCRVYGMNDEQGTMICAYPPYRKKPLSTGAWRLGNWKLRQSGWEASEIKSRLWILLSAVRLSAWNPLSGCRQEKALR